MKRNILIVYKSKNTYSTLSKILQDKNFKVLKALVDNSAIRMLDKYPIDLIISDMELTGFDSMVLLKRIQDKSSGVPILLVSNEAKKYKHEIIKEFGINDILNMPIDEGELDLLVSKYLN